jgi:hypothetical protein
VESEERVYEVLEQKMGSNPGGYGRLKIADVKENRSG